MSDDPSRWSAAGSAATDAGKFTGKTLGKAGVKYAFLGGTATIVTVATGGVGGLAILAALGAWGALEVGKAIVTDLPRATICLNSQSVFNMLPKVNGNLMPGDIVIMKDFSQGAKQFLMHPQQTVRALQDNILYTKDCGVVEYASGADVRISISDTTHGQRVWSYDQETPMLVFRVKDHKTKASLTLLDKLGFLNDLDFYYRLRDFGTKKNLTDRMYSTIKYDDQYHYEDQSAGKNIEKALKSLTEGSYEAYNAAQYVAYIYAESYRATGNGNVPDCLEEIEARGSQVSASDLESALMEDDGDNFVLVGKYGRACEGLLSHMYVVATGDAIGES